MKKYKFLQCLLLISLLFAALASCKDDLSALDVNKLPDVSVDTTGQSTLSVFQFDKLTLDPKVIIKDENEHNFTYEWFINLEPRKMEYVSIGNTKQLDYNVAFVPTTQDKPHQVLLKITDVQSGIVYFQAWPLTIRNGIGEGLVIVETYDGVNTDLSHIMSPKVTPDYNNEKIAKKIYSGVNGGTIPGLVNNLVYTQFGAIKILLGSTSSSLFSINTIDYKLGAKNEKLFYASQDSYGPSYIGGIKQNDIMVHKGQLYASWLETSRFGLPLANNYVIPSVIAINSRYDRSTFNHNTINFYSEEKGQFVYQQALQFGDLVMKAISSSSSSLFNPNNLPNHKAIAAAVNNQGDFMHVLKNKQSANYGLYIMDGFNNPKHYVNLASAPEINEAISFVLLENQNVLLYATKTKIYAVIYGSSTPSFALRYTVAAGDEITSLNQYVQANYPKKDPSWEGNYISTNSKQLILGTYNGTEGKVHILPLINEGIANIDQPNIKTYSGFGKILFTTTQL